MPTGSDGGAPPPGQADRDDVRPGPLHGVRVLDLTSVVMGPLATQLLGDLGADVVCVETAEGDTNRAMGRGPHPELSGVSLNLMRNKRSIALDLKRAEGREAFLRLAAVSDVVVTNLRPGPLARLRLTYADVAAVRPDVVFCTACGYPSDSPDAERPAYDDIIQSASAVGDLFARLGSEPVLLPTLVADKVGGFSIAVAVLAALVHRAATGEGQAVEVPMIDAMAAFMLVEHGAEAIPVPPLGPAGYPRILTPERRPQRTTDGYINVLPYRREDFEAIFAAGGRTDLRDDPRIEDRRRRIANSDSLYRDIAAILATGTTEHWLDFCERHGIPATRAATLDDLVARQPVADHPHAGAYRVIRPAARFSATPAAVRSHAPLVGEHGREVLREAGYDDGAIAALESSGVVGPGAADAG